MLEKIKQRLGIAPGITLYDDEIGSLIEHAKFDMRESGIPQSMIDEESAPILNTVTFFVKREMEEDVRKAERYDKLYLGSVFRLALYEPIEEV